MDSTHNDESDEKGISIASDHYCCCKNCCIANNYDLTGYFIMYCFRYSLWIILTWFVTKYGHSGSDYVINWHEFYPIAILVIIKMIFQICYTFGQKRNELKHDEAQQDLDPAQDLDVQLTTK